MHTFTTVPRLTQPYLLHPQVKMSINRLAYTAVGECLAYSCVLADRKFKFAAAPTCWLPPGASSHSFK